MLSSRVLMAVLSLVAAVTFCAGSGCCRDLAKSSASWTRIDEAQMPASLMRQRVQAAMKGVGLVPDAHEGNLYAGKSSHTAPGSLTFAWRKCVWICTGAPLELVGGVTFGTLFALPTGGWSLIALGGIWQGVDGDLAANHMTFRFESIDLGNGWTRGTCTIESLGMTSTARTMKNELWAKLDEEFPKVKAPATPATSWAD